MDQTVVAAVIAGIVALVSIPATVLSNVGGLKRLERLADLASKLPEKSEAQIAVAAWRDKLATKKAARAVADLQHEITVFAVLLEAAGILCLYFMVKEIVDSGEDTGFTKVGGTGLALIVAGIVLHAARYFVVTYVLNKQVKKWRQASTNSTSSQN